MKKLSIIVPIYNVEKYLRECLDSLVHQDMQLMDYEIILVNDGSSDKSGEIAKEYASDYENVSYYEQNNQGQAVARNFGMDKAIGEYIMFVDSDDYLLDNVLCNIYTEAKNENVDICIAASKVMLEDGTFVVGRDFDKIKAHLVTGRDALLGGLIIGAVWSRVFRKDFVVLENVRFFPGVKHEDVCFNLSLLPKAKRVSFVDNIIYFYRWNSESTDRRVTSDDVYKGLIGNLNVAGLAKDLSVFYRNDDALFNYMKRLSASLVLGDIYSFYTTNRLLLKSLKREYVREAQKMSLIPIERDYLSWRGSIMALFINLTNPL